MDMESLERSQAVYSPEFQELISDDARLKELLEGSHVFSEPGDVREDMQAWERARKFIADAISQDGSILDYGCANGFLLKCLQEWSAHKLDPYGIDIDKEAIEKAKELFPEIPDHFLALDESQKRSEYPSTFRTIYWNVWHDYDFVPEEQRKLLDRLFEATEKGGRLILGFYNDNDRETNKKIIEQLKEFGYKISGTQENPTGGDEIVAWFDKE